MVKNKNHTIKYLLLLLFLFLYIPSSLTAKILIDVKQPIAQGESIETIEMISEAILSGVKQAGAESMIQGEPLETWVLKQQRFYQVKIVLRFADRDTAILKKYSVDDLPSFLLGLEKQSKEVVIKAVLEKYSITSEKSSSIIDQLKMKLIQQENKLADRKDELNSIHPEYSKQNTVKWILGGAGITSLIVSGSSYFLMNQHINSYNEADNTPDTIDAREQAELWATISLSTGILGTSSGIVALIIGDKELKKQNKVIEYEILLLENEISDIRVILHTLEML